MAHATAASLMRTIESLLISNSPVESLICSHREEFHALHEKVSSLEVFLKNLDKSNVSGEMTGLEAQIKEVANVAEHIIQLRVTEVVMAHEKLSANLQQVGRDIDRVRKESTNIQDKGKQTSKDILLVKNNMVGRDGQRKWLLEHLTRDYSGEPKVIPIIGMGGIGKTTLAREVFDDACIRSHFDVRALATLSEQPNIKEILLSLLHSTIKMDDTVKMKGESMLRDMLQKSLKGKRYLIVMDDIWSREAWDDVRLCFPSENNGGSRILLTTRNKEVACYAGSENLSLQMGFMDQNDSWNLFKSVAFANEALASEFETIGKQIVDKCHGLPLTIVVVAGLLKSKRIIKDWESVAENVKSITNDPDKQCLDVLGLSYNDLTSDIKACLLYFGIFPEDTEMSIKRLVRLWMAEGFLNLEKDLEREAEKCLQELVDRCLVLVSKKSRDETKIRSCKVHDLIHDMCLREIQRGNVFVMNDIVFDESDAIKAKTHDILFDCEPSEFPSLSRHKMQPFKRWTDDEINILRDGLYRALLIPGHHQLIDGNNNIHLERTRSIFFSGSYRSTFILKSELIHFKLLRVLDLNDIVIDSFPLEILSLIWLRYLSLRRNEDLHIPPEICRLWNLQTFIVKGYDISVTFPEQIWGLMQLRHLIAYVLDLPDCPSISIDRGKNMGFSNIQTVSSLSLCCCNKEVILGIQNVKKLVISGSSQESVGLLNNVGHLHQLESLSLHWFDFYLDGIIESKLFPATLKKLKLEGTELRWSYLDIIAELPNLEVLKLMHRSCRGREWDPNVSVFACLKILLIDTHYQLKYWKAIKDNFPVLERLFIRYCPELEEIPIEFAEIRSLQLIELKDCTPKLKASAARIQQEQEDLGNNPLVVIIKSGSWSYFDDDEEEKEDDDDDDDDNDDDDDGGGDFEEE